MPITPTLPARRMARGLLLPIGGGYSDILPGFAEAVAGCVNAGELNVVVLPTAYSSDPGQITHAERAHML